MNGWIVRGAVQEQRLALEPRCLNTDIPLVCLHLIDGRSAAAVLLGVDEATELVNALTDFIALTQKAEDAAA